MVAIRIAEREWGSAESTERRRHRLRQDLRGRVTGRLQQNPTRTTAMPEGSATADLALRLIHTQRTLVLATADPEPWAAPVYYVYQRPRFYFFSSENSRHVTAALAANSCATSIFRDSADWREIEGLQMDGHLSRISMGAEALGVFSVYLKKFPTVKDFFVDAAFDFSLFTQRFRTQLYAFVPGRVFYLNNQAGLGNRQEIQLPA